VSVRCVSLLLGTAPALGGIRGVDRSDVRLGINATRPNDLTTLFLCTSPSPKHLESLSGSKVDPSSAHVALGISCVQTRHGHRSERNPCTRASQPVHCTHPCTVNPHLHTELRQGHQGGLYGSRWRADGDLRWVANRVSTTGTRAAGIGMCMRADGQTC
jgi:hypothetical protein